MLNQPTTENATKFLAKNPTFLFSAFGNDYYEHPELGDETTLQVITSDGKKKASSFWDRESVLDFGRSDV
jgi:hypothetical protein